VTYWLGRAKILVLKRSQTSGASEDGWGLCAVGGAVLQAVSFMGCKHAENRGLKASEIDAVRWSQRWMKKVTSRIDSVVGSNGKATAKQHINPYML
jgi:hypothetical protein